MHYFNQTGLGIAEVAMFKFYHQMNGESDVIAEMVCPVEHIPHIITLLQETYSKHMEMIAAAKRINETNKALS